tara:strand:+ start:6119 stop:6856 length:738 start_codon:yes stop_codon:yes gene_type:complete
MSLTIKSTGGDFENLPPGRYRAICYKVVDMGSRMESFQGQPEKPRTKLAIYWEITHRIEGDDDVAEVRMADGRLFVTSKQYTASLHENSTLHKDLKSWRGRSFTPEELAGFEIGNLLGVTCELEMILRSNEPGEDRTKIESLYRPDGGAKRAETTNPAVAFDIDIYCKEFVGESSAESKAMCDIVAEMPPWMAEEVNESMQVLAARERGNSNAGNSGSAAAEGQGGGLSDYANDEETHEPEEIPF